MTDEKKQTKAGTTELSEKDLEKAQGGWSWGETNSSRGVVKKKKATTKFQDGDDLI